MNLYREYNKAKQVFVKPILKFWFGRYSKGRFGYSNRPTIKLAVSKEYYYPSKSVYYRDKDKEYTRPDGTTYKCAVYSKSSHKLPNTHKTVWIRKIRKTLRKYHLHWIPPVIYLPNWCKFGIEAIPLGWKMKWSECRFEHTSSFSIIIFGYQFTWWLDAPKSELGYEDHYWEGVLEYGYRNSLYDTIVNSGYWIKLYKDTEINYFGIRPEYIKPEYQFEYNSATNYIRSKHKDITII